MYKLWIDHRCFTIGSPLATGDERSDMLGNFAAACLARGSERYDLESLVMVPLELLGNYKKLFFALVNRLGGGG